MKKIPFIVVLVFVAEVQMVRGQITVAPTDNLQSLVDANPAGTTFTLLPGVHHDSVTSLKNGDTFTGQPGAVENGANVLTGWSQVAIGGAIYWTTAGGTPLAPNASDAAHCQTAYPGCYLPQDLYLDNTTYTHVLSLADVATGEWYYEYQGLTAATVAAGGSGYAVGDILNVLGGTGGTVRVATLSGTAVVSVTITAIGSGYPTSPATETTAGGTGSGCKLTVTGGSGGVTNNIYLANSENPNAHTVELGTQQWLLQSNSALNITVQGLTWEKYAGGIQHGPVSMGHTGGSGSASGWLIQNNEARLNSKRGIQAGDTAGGAIQVLNNVVHHNGCLGIAGGHLSSALISGNTVYANNTDHVSGSYEAGGIKLVLSSNVTISYNTVHDDEGHGLWSDVNSQHFTFDHNTIYNETGPGIHFEISNYALITNNVAYGNGDQIQISSSSNAVVQNNLLTATSTGAGIHVMYDWNRNSEHPDFISPTGMVFNNNVVTIASGQMGSKVENFNGSYSWEVPGMFDVNTYCVPSLAWTEKSWMWGMGNRGINWTSWQSTGQDSTGTPTLSPCASAVTQPVILSGPVIISGSAVVK